MCMTKFFVINNTFENKNHHLLAFQPRMTEEVKPESSISNP